MNRTVLDYRNTDGQAPTDTRLLQSPLDFIAEDHLRLRMLCAEMDRMVALSDSPLSPPDRDALQGYLLHELPLLLADEDDDLMPLVQSRAEVDDDLPRLAQRLGQDHAQMGVLRDTVLARLQAETADHPPSPTLRSALEQLAALARRHVALENAVLLPLARARLSPGDLADLTRAMLRRRGLDGVVGTPAPATTPKVMP